jgi:hypothetical protein
MTTGRIGNRVTLLPSGLLLVAGGGCDKHKGSFNTVTVLNTATKAVRSAVAVGTDPITVPGDSSLGRTFVLDDQTGPVLGRRRMLCG